MEWLRLLSGGARVTRCKHHKQGATLWAMEAVRGNAAVIIQLLLVININNTESNLDCINERIHLHSWKEIFSG